MAVVFEGCQPLKDVPAISAVLVVDDSDRLSAAVPHIGTGMAASMADVEQLFPSRFAEAVVIGVGTGERMNQMFHDLSILVLF